MLVINTLNYQGGNVCLSVWVCFHECAFPIRMVVCLIMSVIISRLCHESVCTYTHMHVRETESVCAWAGIITCEKMLKWSSLILRPGPYRCKKQWMYSYVFTPHCFKLTKTMSNSFYTVLFIISFKLNIKKTACCYYLMGTKQEIILWQTLNHRPLSPL